MKRSGWDFDYAPLSHYAEPGGLESDFVVATCEDVDAAIVVEALGAFAGRVEVTSLLNVHPLFWTRVELSEPYEAAVIEDHLVAKGVRVRYVVSARRGCQRLSSAADFAIARPRCPRSWRTREARGAEDPGTPGRWFLRNAGVALERACCGTGAGTRIAIIDNDGGDLERIELESEILVGVDSIPRSSSHAAILLGWAVGASARDGDGPRFAGIAPDASPRLYCIPKPGERVFDLPCAIVRAVDDGADVVVCSTYVEGETSPLLDDAFEFAVRLGRIGRGTAIVLPASREISSPPGSTHSSLSLGMAEPASDPRVFCIGPSSLDGRWFLWRDRKGALRPFANRGPSLRWLAPGDDMAFPFAEPERIGHAESSGAAAIAAGVLLLVLAQNPELELEDVHRLITKTASPVDGAAQMAFTDLADARDLLPSSVDSDGHNSKHGYGRIHATRACLAARDPLAATLIFIGEFETAVALERAFVEGRLRRPVSAALGRFLALAVLRDSSVRHALAALVRALRLWTARPKRAALQPSGVILRQVLVTIRLVAASRRVGGGAAREELLELDRAVTALLNTDPRSADATILGYFAAFAAPAEASGVPLSFPDHRSTLDANRAGPP